MFLIRLVCRGEETNRVTNNIETPPTTPDSFKNTLITSSANTVDPKSNVTLDDIKVFIGSNVKNEAVIKNSPNSTNVIRFSLILRFLMHSFVHVLIIIIYTSLSIMNFTG